MTRADLLEVVYRFYPRGLYTTGHGYDDTEERQRQRDAARRGAAEYPTWKAMIRRLGDRYPLTDRSLRILGGRYDPGYSAYIGIPEGGELYFDVSLLGPYYGIHRTGAPGEEPAALDIAQEIEATYRGYEPIPPELGNEVVPDVSLDTKNFGNATIYSCLLSDEWEYGSRPSPRPLVPRLSEAEYLAWVARLERRGVCFVWGDSEQPPHDKEREAGEPLADDQEREAGQEPDDNGAEEGKGRWST